MEDTQGFIWISAFGGLIRWDGQNALQVGAGEWTDRLPTVSVSGVAADPTDGVWALAGKLATVSSRGVVRTMDVEGRQLAPSGDGKLWVVADTSMTLVDMRTRKVVRTVSFASYSASSPLAAEILDGYGDPAGDLGLIDADHRFRIVRPDGSVQFLTSDGHYAAVAADGSVKGDLISGIYDAAARAAGGFWLNHDGSIVGYDGKGGIFPTPADADIKTAATMGIPMYEVPAGKPPGKAKPGDLIASSNGWVRRLAKGATHWTDVDVGTTTRGGYNILVDSRGILWFADWERGAVAVMPSDRGAGGWRPSGEIQGQKLPMLDVIVRGEEVWAASDEYGLYILNRRTGSFRVMGTPSLLQGISERQRASQILQGPDPVTTVGVATATGSLPSNAVIGLACVGTKVWVGMWDGGIAIVDPDTLAVTQLTGPEQEISGAKQVLTSSNVFDITTDADGNAWTSSWGSGVQVLSPDGSPLGSLSPDGNIAIENANPIVMLPLGNDASFAHHRGKAVVAGSAGFELVDLATGKVRRWDHEHGQLAGSIVFSVLDGGNGIFWLGTEAGLERLDTTSSRPATLTGLAQGLRGTVVFTVTQRGNHLLLATNQGLVEVTTEVHPKVVTILDAKDGLSSTEMARYGHAVAPEGTLYLSTADGLSMLAADGPKAIPVSVAALGDLSVEVAGNKVAPAGVITAAAGDRLDFNWVTQNMWRPELTRFQYRLAGGDSPEWTSLFGRNHTTFSPSAGDYTFQVRVLGIGDQVLAEKSQRVKVMPPWYDTWTFRGLLILGIVMLAVWYVAAARRRHRILQDLVTERTAEAVARGREAEAATREIENLLRRVSHDLRSPLNVMVGAMDILQAKPDPGMMPRWLNMGRTAGRRLTLMLDDLVAHARTRTGQGGATAVRPISVEQPIREAIEAVLSTSLSPDREISVVFDQSSPTVLAEVFGVRHILTDLLLNAASHSRPGAITVRCHDGEDPNVTVISVIDPGSGMTGEQWTVLQEAYQRGDTASGIGLGLGLTVTRDICRRLGGRLSVNVEPQRTEVRVELTTAVPPVDRILAVDDDPLELDRLCEALRENGFEVHHTAETAQVPRLLAEYEADAILIPHQCGPWIGADLLDRTAPRTGASWGLRVIALTHYPAAARADGRYAVVLTQPVSPEQVIEAIGKLDQRTTGGRRRHAGEEPQQAR